MSFHQLVNHNEDLRRLVEKGYAVGFDSNCLIVRDVPYLDAQQRLQIGAIVTKMVFVDQKRVQQEDHQIFFAGSIPYNIDGTPIPNLAGGPYTLSLSEESSDVVVQRSFSNKPREAGRFEDFFHKIESYTTIISGPAMELYEEAKLFTFRTAEQIPDSVFKFHDTLTSRAEITDLASKFKDDVIAIIGLGGTGSYVLDFIIRTPVKEIRLFDNDKFHVHNAFRSPGKANEDEFGVPKVSVYKNRYVDYRHGIFAHEKFIDSSCGEDLEGVTFAFVCVDKGSSRAEIFDLLISKQIPFIDVGMGLDRHKTSGLLQGLLRSTYYSLEHGQKIRDMKLADVSDTTDDIYRSNIQLGELNSLNACLAVVKFKQLRGFYSAEESEPFHFLVDTEDLKIVGISELK